MRVLILTEGGNEIGFGHISRCSSLYDEIQKRNTEVKMIIKGSTDIAKKHLLHGRSVEVTDWQSKEFIRSNITKNDYCIIDSYLLSVEGYQLIAKQAWHCLYIDDNARLKYPIGTVVNPSLYTNRTCYDDKGSTVYLLGAEYIILRECFVDQGKLTLRDNVEHVLITMGGSDTKGIIPDILEQLCTVYPNIFFDIVIGQVSIDIEQIHKISPNNTNFHTNLNGNEMKNLMIQADLAITAAGQTIYELLATGIPFIPIQIVDNQINNILGMKALYEELPVIYCGDEDIMPKIKQVFDNYLSSESREAFIKLYKDVVDGYGSQRIIDHLLQN